MYHLQNESNVLRQAFQVLTEYRPYCSYNENTTENDQESQENEAKQTNL